ncbi:MAG TPA: hypothetical protein VG603_04020, partial [Chitinophagales bacterium]|nr:hypothetical protein [Chitinophagales bacterium]
MTKFFTLLICIFLAAGIKAQATLKFCVEAGKDGQCQKQSSQFMITKKGGTISFLLKNDAGIGASKVLYKIYKLERNGTET